MAVLEEAWCDLTNAQLGLTPLFCACRAEILGFCCLIWLSASLLTVANNWLPVR